MSNDDRLLVIDEGTTGTRALVFDGAGRRLSASYSEFTQHHPAPDRVEHDAEEIWQRSLERIREALTESGTTPDALAAVGITNQRDRRPGGAARAGVGTAGPGPHRLDHRAGLLVPVAALVPRPGRRLARPGRGR
jgi:N-acetylglucosamine kinase-like BadF-type ATPase